MKGGGGEGRERKSRVSSKGSSSLQQLHKGKAHYYEAALYAPLIRIYDSPDLNVNAGLSPRATERRGLKSLDWLEAWRGVGVGGEEAYFSGWYLYLYLSIAGKTTVYFSVVFGLCISVLSLVRCIEVYENTRIFSSHRTILNEPGHNG